MSTNIVRRGFVPTDEKEFGEKSLQKLREAQKDVFMLINRGYPIKSASTFVGNHYLLSERQRLALTRAISSKESIENRRIKEIKEESFYFDFIEKTYLNVIRHKSYFAMHLLFKLHLYKVLLLSYKYVH